jgi:hypothetical protein
LNQSGQREGKSIPETFRLRGVVAATTLTVGLAAERPEEVISRFKVQEYHKPTEASDEQTAQLATAHKKKNKPTKHWDFTEATVAAGGVRSSHSDMINVLRANVYPEESGMTDELALMRQPSKLPECEDNRGLYTFFLWFRAIAYVGILAIVGICLFGRHWLTQIGPDGLLH